MSGERRAPDRSGPARSSSIDIRALLTHREYIKTTAYLLPRPAKIKVLEMMERFRSLRTDRREGAKGLPSSLPEMTGGELVRGYELPGFVGPRSIVAAVSYSGATEETLAAVLQAERAGATVFAITSGGSLAQAAERGGVLVPRGLAPRAALGYLMLPLLAALERWKLVGPCGKEVEAAAEALDTLAGDCAPDVPTLRNPAKRLAEQLAGRVPAVYAASPWLEAAARRWKCQFNENSKTLATWSVFPELNHNETVGWGAPPELAGRFAVVMLLDGAEPAHLAQRIRLTTDLALGPAADVHEVRARGTGRLARLLSLVSMGDLVSVYLAYLRGIDPTPVEIIATIKQKLHEIR